MRVTICNESRILERNKVETSNAKRIFILVRWLTYADAVSNDVFGLSEALKRNGFSVEIICQEHHRRLRSLGIIKLKNLDPFQLNQNDVVIYHLTSGWPEGLEFLKNLKSQKILRYHNITPAHFYEGISDSHTQRCLQGYEELARYKHINFEGIVATSQYTLQSLHEKEFHCKQVGVIPPFHHTEALKKVSRHERLYRKLSDNKINILSVGRISPNKGYLQLIEAFAHYCCTYHSQARLILFGKRNWKLKKYTRAIKKAIKQLGIKKNVYWVNGGDLSKLRSCYGAAKLLISLSEHEGFCVPLVEAMAFGVPILVSDATALPETAGDAGYLVDTRMGPHRVGCRIHKLLSTEGEISHSVQKGRLRYEHSFAPDKIEKHWLQLIQRLKE